MHLPAYLYGMQQQQTGAEFMWIPLPASESCIDDALPL